MKRFPLLTAVTFCTIMAFVACDKNNDPKPDNGNSTGTETVPEQPIDSIIEEPIPAEPQFDTIYEEVPDKFWGAELWSKTQFTYGRFEAKMKMIYNSGCISSMFLYKDGSDQNTFPWEEIDIEIVGNSKWKNNLQTNLITGKASSREYSEKHHALDFAPEDDFHTYMIEWTPDYIAWFVDGTEIRRTVLNDPADMYKQVAKLTSPESLRFNVWSSAASGWVGSFNKKTGANLPQQQRIEYVKVWSYNTETKEFTELWQDDFDSFNSTRWGKGNWQMENVTLKESNVTIDNGQLVLEMNYTTKKVMKLISKDESEQK